ncbi:MAG TPA: PA0069 family radical SAM protein [Alphaproteobacteria bacterium]|nr:PA0069 family radical SAM protein [Alphaproteobacteria bacterium]
MFDRSRYVPPMAKLPIRTQIDAVADRPRKGRGAVSNRASARFEDKDRVAIDDGWGAEEPEDWESAPTQTILGIDTAKKVITRNQSPDVGFDRSINPYKGCEHGCIYCFARPTHAYLGLSPGLDFETRIFRKPDAPALLRRELSARGYRPATIQLGINTDAYQPAERTERLTRRILEVLAEFEHPVGILTKSALIQRDLDILVPMAEKRLVKTGVSITSLDRNLARMMEPRAATPGRRIETVHALASAGVPVTVMVAPIVPGLTCHEMESILDAAAEAGAERAGMTIVRLPHEIKDLFREWLRAHFPDRADKVLSLIRQCRGGRLNDPEFGTRMVGTGPYAELLHKRFSLAVARRGLDRPRTPLDVTRFRVPQKPTSQLSLF